MTTYRVRCTALFFVISACGGSLLRGKDAGAVAHQGAASDPLMLIVQLYPPSVVCVDPRENGEKPRKLVDGIWFKNCTMDGRFICQRHDGKNAAGNWLWGDIRSPEKLNEIAGVPEWARDPALSRDGGRIAWFSGKWTPEAHGLQITDLVSGVSTEAVPARKGAVGACAWSPDGKSLAYYFAEESHPDAFALRIVDLSKRPPKDRAVAPPSESQLLQARVDPPRWSPDGKMLSFKGEYGPGQQGGPIVLRYTISSDGKDLKADPGDAIDWLADGRHMVKVWDEKVDVGHPTKIKIVLNELGSGRDQTFEFSVPVGFGDLKWSPDGKELVGTRQVNDQTTTLSILDPKTGQVRDVFTAPEKHQIRSFYWVRADALKGGDQEGEERRARNGE